MNIGFCGVGTVASWVSSILNQLGDEKIRLYACAASHLEKAQAFAEKFSFEKAYGSTEELFADGKVDVVYIAVPNDAHYALCRRALESGKHVICEKPFAVNDAQCAELIALAREKGLFLSEALWPAFLPAHRIIDEEIARGTIGKVVSGRIVMLDSVMFLERVKRLETGGGSLLDGGPYTLGCMVRHFGTDIEKVENHARLLPSGVDAEDEITVTYRDGRVVTIRQTIDIPREEHEDYFEIVGTKGKIRADAVANPRRVVFTDLEGNVILEPELPPQIKNRGMPPVSGYEYEFIAFEKALASGKKETAETPLSDTLAISRIMTEARRQAGVVFPFEEG